MKDKESVPSVIAAYRRRQARAQRMLLLFWVVVMIIIVGAGFLASRLLKPNSSETKQALAVTETPGTQEIATQNAPTGSPLVPTAAQVLSDTETPAPSVTPTTSSLKTYTVKQGDTLVSIAQQLGVGLNTLIELNPSVTPEFLSVGDQLSVPAQAGSSSTVTPAPAGFSNVIEYRVVAGDTLASIATRFGSTIGAIVQENNLASADQIRVGQTLKIPVTAGTPTPAETPTP